MRHRSPLPRIVAAGLTAAAAVISVLSATTASATGPAELRPATAPDPHTYRHGVVPMLTSHRADHHTSTSDTAAAAVQLEYGGGVDGVGVTTGPEQVYLVFWGTQWGTASTNSSGYITFTGDPWGGAPTLQAMFRGLGSNNELWSGVMTQYCEGVAQYSTTCPANAPHVAYPATGGALAGVWYDNRTAAPNQASGQDLGAEAIAAAQHFGNATSTANRNAQYVVLSPTGTHPDGFPSSSFCAWHSSTYDAAVSGQIAFTNMPYVMDAGTGCGQNWVNSSSAGVLDGWTMVEGHEYAETITDQFPSGGWTENGNSSTENADKCAWLQPGTTGGAANLTLSTGSFAEQGTWSNDANGGTGGCLFTHPVVGGGTGSATGPISSAIAGKCVDDNAGSTANGNKIQLWTCNGTAAQQFTVNADGSLSVEGKCMDVTGQATANGAPIELWDCNGGSNQKWSPQPDGSLRGVQSGRCLDAPGFSSTDGTQLELWDCNGGANQHWTLP